MVSTPSSSSDRTTACAPVSCWGAILFAWLGRLLGSPLLPAPPLAGCSGADHSCGGVVGALTVSSSSCVFSTLLSGLFRGVGQEKTPVSSAAVRGSRRWMLG